MITLDLLTDSPVLGSSKFPSVHFLFSSNRYDSFSSSPIASDHRSSSEVKYCAESDSESGIFSNTNGTPDDDRYDQEKFPR